MTFEEIASELQLFHGFDRVDYDRKRKAFRFALSLNGVRVETGWRNAEMVASGFDRLGAKKFSAEIKSDARDAARIMETRHLENFGAWGLVR